MLAFVNNQLCVFSDIEQDIRIWKSFENALSFTGNLLRMANCHVSKHILKRNGSNIHVL